MVNCQDDTCTINSIITIDAKGQIILPKDLREKANFKPNDKLAIVTCEKDGAICCLMMIKTEKLTDAVTKTLSPLLKAVTTQKG
ncbi:HgcAB-associated protein [Candidatus Bathycorpusculum sp.]|jgi:AbrB family looped-hinge helix DNA binding protein|uniref:HgcAB-associated protein HgcC n=1 Tax=Candidatus Bathycorpusculum sp. TaxID=2994959 RepID=UPI002836E3C1|nr:AbrB/MazE/SpoVT family DNA-binding domain-containing protein [Candidatus Termitimicrobium sp.]